LDTRYQTITEFKAYLERRFPCSRTSKDYVCDIQLFAAFCHKPWLEVSMTDIDAFVDQQRQQGLSNATIRRRVASLKVFFDFIAEEQGDLTIPNPVRFKRHAGKKAKTLPRDLTNQQIVDLWSVISSERDRAWFALMLRAGLRVGEVVSLGLEDILSQPEANQPARVRVCGKGQKERVVLLTSDAYEVVQEWLTIRPQSEHLTVFLNQRRKPLTVNGIEWLLNQYGKQANIKVTPHKLRHTFARQLTEGGMPLTSLSKLLGHSQVTTTQIYTAGADPQLAKAYQQAMAELESQDPSDLNPQPDMTPPPPVEPVVEPPQPDWQAWSPDLPDGLRQTTVAFVQHRYPTWKPQRRREWAMNLLVTFRNFWLWQLSHRPISHPTELTLADLQQYQTDQIAADKRNSTIRRCLDDLLALLRRLADHGEPVAPAIFRLSRLPRPQSLPRHLSESDSQTLSAYMRKRLDSDDPLLRLENSCFFILAHSGLRARELVDLVGQDLDLFGKRLWVRQGKGLRDRVVYLSDTTQLALTRYLATTQPSAIQPLLVRPDGKPITYSWLRRHISDLGQTAGGIVVSPHILRHTLATRLLNAGMKITRIQKILGHDNLSTTMIYAHVLDSTVEADYQQAMRQIESKDQPLSQTPQLVTDWPIPQIVEEVV